MMCDVDPYQAYELLLLLSIIDPIIDYAMWFLPGISRNGTRYYRIK
jgi:hypothetical protein